MASARAGRRDRFRREPADSIVTTDRDRALVVEVARHRVVSKSQVMAAGFFNSTTRTNDRLRKLWDAGYLRRRFEPEGSFGAEALYEPGPASAEWLAEDLGVEIAEARRMCREPVSPSMLRHALKVVDVRLAIARRFSARGFEVAGYRSEAECFHEYAVREGTAWKWRSLRPDAWFSVPGTRFASCFLEVDLATCSPKAFALKAKGYAEYFRLGLFREIYGGDSFSVIVVTTDRRRIAKLAAAVPAAEPRFLFTTFGLVVYRSPSAEIWTEGGGR